MNAVKSIVAGVLCLAAGVAGAKTVELAAGGDLASAVTEALSDGDPAVVRLAEGDFYLPDLLTVEGPVTISGAGVGKTFIRPSYTTYRLMTINHADAVLEKVTIGFTRNNLNYNKRPLAEDRNNLYGMAVRIKAGTVRDSRVTDCIAKNYYQWGAVAVTGERAQLLRCEVDGSDVRYNEIEEKCGGVYLSSGLVEDCYIHDNIAQTGAGVYMTGGRLVRSRVLGNKTLYFKNAPLGNAAGVYMTGGSIDSSTVAWNVANIEGGIGGVYMGGGTISNSVIRCNVSYEGCEGTPDIQFSKDSLKASAVVNCALPVGFGVNPVTGPAELNADGTLQPGSACIGAATHGGDVGACAFDGSVLSCGVLLSASAVLEGTSVTATPVVRGNGGGDSFSCSWTVKDADGRTVASSSDQALVREFPSSGLYSVELSVTAGGRSATAEAKALRVAKAEYEAADVAALTAAYEEATDGSVIRLTATTYTLPSTLILTKGVRIEGLGADKTVLTVSAKAAEDLSRVLLIDHPDAEVTKVKITGGRLAYRGKSTQVQASGFGVCVGYLGGTLSDSRVTANNVANYEHRGAASAIGPRSRITRCVIDNNKNSYSDTGATQSGGGVYVNDGLVDSCLIRDNVCDHNGGGALLSGAGRLVNCTIVGNSANKGLGGGVCLLNGQGEVRNCIFADNAAPKDTSSGKPEWAPSPVSAANYLAVSNAFHTCAFKGAAALVVGEGSISLTDNFIDASGGDYHLPSGAKTVEAGSDFAEADTSFDMDGMVRKSGTAVDIGCYEMDMSTFSCLFTCATTKVFVGTPVTIESGLVGADDAAEFDYAWTFTDTQGHVLRADGKDYTGTLPAGRYKVRLDVAQRGTTKTYFASVPNFLVVAARTNYVVAAASSATMAYPYATPETAHTNVHELLIETIPGSVVRFLPGVHTTTNEIIVGENLTLEGEDWRTTAVTLSHAKAVPVIRVFRLTGAGSRVKGLTISGGRVPYRADWGGDGYGCGVWITDDGGTLELCRVCGNAAAYHYVYGGGVAVMSSAGRVSRCLVEANDVTYGDSIQKGGGVYMTAGLVENCLIVSNRANRGGGVDITGTGVLRNCNVCFNVATNTERTVNNKGRGGGVYIENAAGGRIENTIFWGNDSSEKDPAKYAPAQGYPEWSSDASGAKCAFSRCAFGDGVVTNSYIGGDCILIPDPLFADAAALDFRINVRSPCRNGGRLAEGPYDPLDYLGNPRVYGRRPDIGAVECQQGFGLMLMVR